MGVQGDTQRSILGDLARGLRIWKLGTGRLGLVEAGEPLHSWLKHCSLAHLQEDMRTATLGLLRVAR